MGYQRSLSDGQVHSDCCSDSTLYTPGLGPWALSGKIKQPGSAGCEEVDGEGEGGKDSSSAAAPHLEEE